MSGLLSIYLDALRFIAAMGVFLSHAEQHSGAPGVLPKVFFDHKLVVIFFVISGYVIAASASRPDRTFVNYAADRLARLSSVVIPALLLTYCLDGIGSLRSPELYANFDPHWQGIRLVVNLLYCQQLWFWCINPSSNTPIWSLGYEFWYYALFGIAVFVRPKHVKMLLLLLVSLIIGPKILLLLPAWIVGALAFHLTKTLHCTLRASLIGFIATAIGMIVIIFYGMQLGLSNGKSGLPPLYYSSDYLGDNLLAMIISINFIFCGLLSKHITLDLEPYKAVKIIRWLASHTFSLYVYHMPILFFIRAVTRYDANNLYAVLASLLLALLLIIGLSKITEERLPVLRLVLRRWLKETVAKARRFSNRGKLPIPQNTL